MPRRTKSPPVRPVSLSRLRKSALRLLANLAAHGPTPTAGQDVADLLAADLAVRCGDGQIAINDAGRAHLLRQAHARHEAAAGVATALDPFRAQHLDLAIGDVTRGRATVTVDTAESPLAWLARRKSREGCALIGPEQLQAGERLRADFTLAHMMPRVTANWSAPVEHDRRGGGTVLATDTVLTARQRVRQALDAVGPEFAGLLLDVCCFLKRLEDVERERTWPARSAKIVLQLGLDRLARHYGYAAAARGPAHAPVRSWLAPDEAFASEA